MAAIDDLKVLVAKAVAKAQENQTAMVNVQEDLTVAQAAHAKTVADLNTANDTIAKMNVDLEALKTQLATIAG